MPTDRAGRGEDGVRRRQRRGGSRGPRRGEPPGADGPLQGRCCARRSCPRRSRGRQPFRRRRCWPPPNGRGHHPRGSPPPIPDRSGPADGSPLARGSSAGRSPVGCSTVASSARRRGACAWKSTRALLAHEDAAYEEWRFSGSIAYSPGKDGRGGSMNLGSAWGSSQSGVQSLWSGRDAAGLARISAFEAAQRFQAELGYGMAGDGGNELLRMGAKLTSGPNVEAGCGGEPGVEPGRDGRGLERAVGPSEQFGIWPGVARDATAGGRPPVNAGLHSPHAGAARAPNAKRGSTQTDFAPLRAFERRSRHG